RNPVPSEVLDEAAWNQMVLKALFVEVPLAPITGLDERYNDDLAQMLTDFAAERSAAGRPVPGDLTALVERHAAKEAGA
ncbi:MAG: EboA domain-containing protein, partial [Planctomycetota bacterium]